MGLPNVPNVPYGAGKMAAGVHKLVQGKRLASRPPRAEPCPLLREQLGQFWL